MNNLAPVLIPTLNRYNHFKNCVDSLAKCTHADKTDLFVAFDYPLNESHWEGYKNIRNYIRSIKGFKSVNIIQRETNFGAWKNVQDTRLQIFENNNRLILSEDDNIFSPDFLVFVNRGLDVYEDREDIYSISGYQYPLVMPKNYNQDVYLWQGYSAWGVGIWREKWKKVPWERDEAINKIKRFLKSYTSIYKHHKVANHYIPAKLKMIEQNRIHGDGYINLYQFLNNMYSVFPVISRVRNMGHDGSGIGCGYMENDIYAQQEVYSGEVGKCIMPADLQPQNEINKVLSKHFRRPLKSKIKTMGKIVLLNAGLWP